MAAVFLATPCVVRSSGRTFLAGGHGEQPHHRDDGDWSP